eukprot:10912512-Karenia_brevis.AAC.1
MTSWMVSLLWKSINWNMSTSSCYLAWERTRRRAWWSCEVLIDLGHVDRPLVLGTSLRLTYEMDGA